MLSCYMLSQSFLKLSSFLKFFISAALLGCFFLPCLPNCWFGPLTHLTCCLFLPVYYLFQILHTLFFDCSSFVVSIYFFMCWVSLQSILWIVYVINCLPLFNLSLLMENSLVLSFGACFFVFPLWSPLCVCFYVLSGSAKTSLQVYIRHCMLLARGNLFGAISDP